MWPDGSVYVGNFLNNQRLGGGTLYDKTGKLVYYGEFKDDEPVETYPSTGNYSTYKFTIRNNGDDIYMGETKDNKRHGKGIYFWKDGDMWYGEWEEGLRDGYGIHIYSNGTMQTGTWKNDDYTP